MEGSGKAKGKGHDEGGISVVNVTSAPGLANRRSPRERTLLNTNAQIKVNGSGPKKAKDAGNQNKDLSIIAEGNNDKTPTKAVATPVNANSSAYGPNSQDGPKRSYLQLTATAAARKEAIQDSQHQFQ